MKISRETAATWGISVTKDGVPFDFIEIESDVNTVLHLVDGKEVESSLADGFDNPVEGLFHYLLVIGK